MPFWPRLSGPEPQPQEGSISLKDLVETRQKSECFEQLNDILVFLVQKLQPKILGKINTLRAGLIQAVRKKQLFRTWLCG